MNICLGLLLTTLVLSLILVILWIYTIVWIRYDTRSRASEDPFLWIFLAVLFGPFMTFIWLAFRPKGDVMKCGNCDKNKLFSLVNCPHCGYGKDSESRLSEIDKALKKKPKWIKTAPTGVKLRKNKPGINRKRSDIRTRAGLRRESLRDSGSCPYCMRDIYDHEEICPRCGKRI